MSNYQIGIYESARVAERNEEKRNAKKSKRKLIAKDTDNVWSEAPPCLVHMKLNGVPEGCRNNALFSYGVFFKKVHPEI